ncbi:MAG: PKD domain-containing protein [Candidatus Methylacidiphilales bacterium]
MRKGINLFFIILFYLNKLDAQVCTIQTNDTIVCLNNALNYSATFTTGLTPTTYEWDFGNGVKSSQSSNTYNYPLVGIYFPTLKITFSNNSQCFATGKAIRVVALPKSNFRILSDTFQCFKNNLVCIKDSATEGASNSPITKRTFIWGDGVFVTQFKFNDTICNNYKYTAGGVYSLVLEVTDSNNCFARFERKNAIRILPQLEKINFSSVLKRCDSTVMIFSNTSAFPYSKVKKFVWDFGDGNIDSSGKNWGVFEYLYQNIGDYRANLIIQDKFNCIDTAGKLLRATKKVMDTKVNFWRNSQCYNLQAFSVTYKDAVEEDSIIWKVYSSSNRLIDSVYNFAFFNPANSYDCGKYRITMDAYYDKNCKISIDTSFEIFGPRAVLTPKLAPVVNQYQCNTNDTVYFRNPVPEYSCLNNNSGNWLWDFADGFAPPCTTDTKNGLNIGLNCRYSKDRDFVKHKFNAAGSNCYFVKMFITDTVYNCSDLDSTKVVIGNASAAPNLPARRGLYYYTTPPGNDLPPQNCFQNAFVFKFDETLPSCGRESIWIMPDSAAERREWLATDPWKDSIEFIYNRVGDSSGWVTVGLIVKNGECIDTFWYHRMFRILQMNPKFNIEFKTKCFPYLTNIYFVDSLQDSVKRATISIYKLHENPVSEEFVQSFSQVITPSDSVIRPINFSFNQRYKYKVEAQIVNSDGCVATYGEKVNIGYYRTKFTTNSVFCVSDSADFYDDFEYYGQKNNNWKNEARANANLERLWWNFGDTIGYQFLGILPKHKYHKVGSFNVTLLVQDSVGCLDTLKNLYNIKTVNVKAAIEPITKELLCAPKVLTLKSISTIIDNSVQNGQSPYDYISSWLWDFGDGKVPSISNEPTHDYSENGDYNVVLKIRTMAGCSDSATMPITIKGPKPKYNFAMGDTFGCSPVRLTLNNSTQKQLLNWQWKVDGPSNFVVSTNKDSAMPFELVKAGRYRILLLGTDSFINEITGQKVFCTSVFPDTNNLAQRPVYVTVVNKPSAQLFGPDTVCVNNPFTISAVTDSIYSQFIWQVSNGFNSGIKPRSDSVFNYTFKDSGSYFIKLIPIPSIGIQCIDTPVHQVVAGNVNADFDIDASQSPLFLFKNKSLFANSFEWNFGDPASGINNQSFLRNPSHTYIDLSDSIKVCLITNTFLRCFDTICKLILPKPHLINIPNVFTPNNDCVNDAFDIEIIGYSLYDLVIFNRWGGKVFEGKNDGIRNDGNNWNGNNFNDGEPNTDGVYFYIFRYKLNFEDIERTAHGTITLIRK